MAYGLIAEICNFSVADKCVFSQSVRAIDMVKEATEKGRTSLSDMTEYGRRKKPISFYTLKSCDR